VIELPANAAAQPLPPTAQNGFSAESRTTTTPGDLVRRFHHEVCNRADEAVAREILFPDFQVPGLAGSGADRAHRLHAGDPGCPNSQLDQLRTFLASPQVIGCGCATCPEELADASDRPAETGRSATRTVK
jgi:hypothetical protein